MLRLPVFKYLVPRSRDEAGSLIKRYNGKAKLLAGGTDLLPSMKDRLLTPEYILDIRELTGLSGIKEGPDNRVRIGSLTGMHAIEESPVLKKHFPCLTDAAASVGAPALRNMGTLGGNIALETRCNYYNQSRSWRKSIDKCMKLGGDVCHVVKGAKRCYACFVADTVPALIALDARIIIMGSEGERQSILKDIYTRDGRSPNLLKSTDIISEVILPLPVGKSGSSYKKLSLREAIDFPLAGIAAHVIMDGDILKDVKIVLGAVDSGPIEVNKAEDVLRGKAINNDLINEAGNMAQDAAHPVANRGSSPSYRKKMVGVFTQTALREAVARAGKWEEK